MQENTPHRGIHFAGWGEGGGMPLDPPSRGIYACCAAIVGFTHKLGIPLPQILDPPLISGINLVPMLSLSTLFYTCDYFTYAKCTIEHRRVRARAALITYRHWWCVQCPPHVCVQVLPLPHWTRHLCPHLIKAAQALPLWRSNVHSRVKKQSGGGEPGYEANLVFTWGVMDLNNWGCIPPCMVDIAKKKFCHSGRWAKSL